MCLNWFLCLFTGKGRVSGVKVQSLSEVGQGPRWRSRRQVQRPGVGSRAMDRGEGRSPDLQAGPGHRPDCPTGSEKLVKVLWRVRGQLYCSSPTGHFSYPSYRNKGKKEKMDTDCPIRWNSP